MSCILQLVYISQAAPGFDADGLVDLVARANRHNRERNLTGALHFGDGTFLQVLEGHEREVVRLYARIHDDPRHVDVQLLTIRQVKERSFPTWGMALVQGRKCDERSLTAIRARAAADGFWDDAAPDEILRWFRRDLLAPAA